VMNSFVFRTFHFPFSTFHFPFSRCTIEII
jgi:hypothetical protein